MTVNAKPDGFHTITPLFQVKNADGFLEFLKDAFGAETKEMFPTPDGRIGHAEVRIGDSVIMLTDAEAVPSTMHLYLDDVDAVYTKAIRAGAMSDQGPADKFWGDRQASLRDAWGNMWFIATHKEDVAPDELQSRMAAFLSQT